MKKLLALALLATLIPLGIACGDDDDEAGDPDDATSTLAATSPAATASEEPGVCSATATASTGEPTPATTGGTDPVEGAAPAVPPVATLIDVRYACHEDFDRIVFDFRDNSPGYVVEYVDPPIVQDGSGEPVEIDGEAFLNVRFNPAQAHDDAGESTYTGPREITPGLASVSEMEMAGDFEGYVTWGIGLPEELDFRVFPLEDPFRVVIDIAHP
jgi:hypothetical protein